MSLKGNPLRGQTRRSGIKTCDLCKIRHQKCSGESPTCACCKLNSVECVYSSTPAHRLSHPPTRRPKSSSTDRPATPCSNQTPDSPTNGNALPAQDYEAVHSLLDSDLDTLNLSEAARHALVRAVTERVWKQPTLQLNFRSLETTPPRSTTDYLLERLNQVLSQDSGTEMYILNEVIAHKMDHSSILTPSSSTDAGKPSVWAKLAPPLDTAKQWLTTFLNGPNMLYRMCSQEESMQLVEALYSGADMSLSSRCLILSQLAAGCRFTQGTTEDLYGRIFDEASAVLELCIEMDGDNLLMVLQPLLLKILYILPGKPQNCWIILSTAIHIAQSYGIDLGRDKCRGVSDAEHIRWREVWGAILNLDAWLSVTLGRRPQLCSQTTYDPFVHDAWTNSSRAETTIGSNIAKLSILMSRFMIDLCDNTITTERVQKYLHMLEEWSFSLPKSLRYFPDTDGPRDPSLTVEDEVASLYLEMFYFATILALTKPSLFAVVDLLQADTSLIPLHLRFLAQTCLDSANQIGQTAVTIMKRAFLCKRSWLVTVLNYHASLVILLSLSVRRSKSRYSMGSQHALETPSLASLKTVLKTSASADHFAQSYLGVVEHFEGIILNKGRPGGYPVHQTAATTTAPIARATGSHWSFSSTASSMLTNDFPSGLVPSDSSISSDSFPGGGGVTLSPPYAFDLSTTTAEPASFAWLPQGQGHGHVELLPQDPAMTHFLNNNGCDLDLSTAIDTPTASSQHYTSFLHNFYGVAGH